MRRVLIFLILAVIVVGGMAMARRAQPPAGDSAIQSTQIIDRATVEQGDLRLTVSATGAVIPRRQVPLLFEASGVVRDVLVADGDIVAKGDALAQLDTADLDAALNDALVGLSIQQINYEALSSPASEADLAAARAAVNAAQASLNAALNSGDPNQAEVTRLRSELSRNQLWQAQLQDGIASNTPGFSPDISGLIPDGVDVSPEVIAQINQGLSGLIPSFPSMGGVSPETLQQAEYGVQIADANAAAAANRGPDPGGVASANAAVVSAQQQLNRLENGASEFDLQAASINLNLAQLSVQQAQAALDRATIYAPFDGVVAQNNLVEGEVPPNAQPALLLIDNGELYVDLAVDETDVVKLALGQAVELVFDGLPGAEITGNVTRIAVTPTIAGQLVTYAVRVTLDPTDEPVRIGMSATATVIVDQLDDVLIVPNRFIRIDRATGDAFVTVAVENGRFSEIAVELGLRNELSSEIVGGLDAGQQIVLLPRAAFDVFGG
jgi:HlyD family secretion protein